MKDATPIETHESNFIQSFNAIANQAHRDMVANGWWKERWDLIKLAEAHSPEMGKFARAMITGTQIALEHSELSESLEGLRHGNPPDDKIPRFTSEEAESADVILRIMDKAAERGLRIAEALIEKRRMNTKRGSKHGGKSC